MSQDHAGGVLGICQSVSDFAVREDRKRGGRDEAKEKFGGKYASEGHTKTIGHKTY